ncbi:MAG TPA: phage minor head protein [Spirochaetota bacterium]|nr:phage minor head protein [Spirochaetota bacterium]
MISFETLPFDEAIKFFRDKTVLTPGIYRALVADARAKAFSVAGVARMDILTDIYAAIDRAISEGTTFGDFKKTAKQIMARRGWEGANPYRLDTVFRTNIQSAYQAGHYERQMEVAESLPYWQYVAVMDGRTRPMHAVMNGRTLRCDDPFWQTSYPPNGFNCRCTVRALSKEQLARENLTIEKKAPPIADPGFDHNPGSSVGRTLTDEQFLNLQGDPDRWEPLIGKTYADYSRPPAREVNEYVRSSVTPWPRGEKALEMYRTTLMGRTLRDAIDDPLVMNEAFIEHLKLDGRERFLPFIEEAVRTPYEIWLQAEKERVTGKVVLRKRYISLIETEKKQRMLFVAEGARGQWVSYTFIKVGQANYLDGSRQGVLLYGR